MALKSDRQLKRFYNTFNRLHFDNELPECHIWWEPLGGSTFGDCLYLEDEKVWRIRMNPFMAGWKGVYKFTLLHEMVHVKLSPYMKHGKKFNAEMLRLAEKGAFNNLW